MCISMYLFLVDYLLWCMIKKVGKGTKKESSNNAVGKALKAVYWRMLSLWISPG